MVAKNVETVRDNGLALDLASRKYPDDREYIGRASGSRRQPPTQARNRSQIWGEKAAFFDFLLFLHEVSFSGLSRYMSLPVLRLSRRTLLRSQNAGKSRPNSPKTSRAGPKTGAGTPKFLMTSKAANDRGPFTPTLSTLELAPRSRPGPAAGLSRPKLSESGYALRLPSSRI